MPSRLSLDWKRIFFDLRSPGGIVDRGAVSTMRHLERSAKSLTPVRSGYMRAHWEWERRSAGTALGYSLGNSADYATYRMLGVSAKRVTGKAMPVGRTQVVGNPWPASGRITWARYRKGYPGKDIIHLAMAKTAVARRLV